MFIDYKLEGKYVSLRSVEESDSEFILNTRNDPRISKYLPPLNITIEQQRQWISNQRADKDSLYFLLETPEGVPIGTIGIYDIVDGHGEGGRSFSIGEPFANVEAGLLQNDYVFDVLKLKYISIWVYEGNKSVISLNQSNGFEWIEYKQDEKGQPIRVGILTREKWCIQRKKLLNKLRISY